MSTRYGTWIQTVLLASVSLTGLVNSNTVLAQEDCTAYLSSADSANLSRVENSEDAVNRRVGTALEQARSLSSDADTVSDNPELAKQLVDPAFDGMILLGRQGQFRFYFDKRTQQIVASDGDASFAVGVTNDAAKTPYDLNPGGLACRAACWGAAGAGCAAVSCVCAAGTVVTVGGFALPCSWAIVAACLASGAGASVCSDYCTEAFGG